MNWTKAKGLVALAPETGKSAGKLEQVRQIVKELIEPTSWGLNVWF